MQTKDYRGFRDLIVYQKSYQLAIDVFKLTKLFPKEEKYVLVDQMRRASRSIPANLAEAWARRRYPKSFINKLVDCHGEELEMEVWINMALDFEYITESTHNELIARYSEISKMLNSMENQPEKFCKTPH